MLITYLITDLQFLVLVVNVDNFTKIFISITILCKAPSYTSSYLYSMEDLLFMLQDVANLNMRPNTRKL